MSGWESVGCPICRAAMIVDVNDSLPVIVEIPWLMLRRCQSCGAWWEENLRFMQVISEAKAREQFPDAFAPDRPSMALGIARTKARKTFNAFCAAKGFCRAASVLVIKSEFNKQSKNWIFAFDYFEGLEKLSEIQASAAKRGDQREASRVGGLIKQRECALKLRPGHEDEYATAPLAVVWVDDASREARVVEFQGGQVA